MRTRAFAQYIAIGILVALMSISIVSLIGMAEHAGCIAETLNSGTCPVTPLASLNFHFSAYGKLAQAVLLFFFAACFVAFALVLDRSLVIPKVPVRYALLNPQSPTFAFRRWLALHETSPTFVA